MSCTQNRILRRSLVAAALCLPVLARSDVLGQWEQIHKLIAEDAAAADYFGYSVSISGNTIVAGAHWDDDAGTGSGSAYVFDAPSGEQLHKLTANDAAAGDRFGCSVSVSGNNIVTGAWLDDNACPSDPDCNSGSAYVFQPVVAPCPADTNDDGTVDVLDLLAVLAEWGPCT